MPVIATQALCKSFGAFDVLQDVEFSVEKGKLVGFLGPNGAGKTTTIRILLGLLRATSGEATIFDQPAWKNGKQIRSEIGYLAGDVHFYSTLSGYQTLQFLANARKRNCEREIERLTDLFQLDAHKSVRSYSTGMRQKLGLIQALMHQPQLLILDEPTSALDPLIRNVVFAELKRVANEGRTVLFSSHSLDEVEQLCDEVVILRQGRIVEHQKINTLKKQALKKLRFTLVNGLPHPVFPQDIRILEQNGNSIVATWTGELKPLLDWLGTIELSDLVIERPDLNDLFLSYYSSGSVGSESKDV